MRGVSPGGSHYYPAFPYLSYQRMNVEDVIHLKAFMDTLPKVAGQAPAHDLPLPFRLRRGRLIGWLALAGSVGLVLLYLPGSPAALAWPIEWGLVGLWFALGWLAYRRLQ